MLIYQRESALGILNVLYWNGNQVYTVMFAFQHRVLKKTWVPLIKLFETGCAA